MPAQSTGHARKSIFFAPMINPAHAIPNRPNVPPASGTPAGGLPPADVLPSTVTPQLSSVPTPTAETSATNKVQVPLGFIASKESRNAVRGDVSSAAKGLTSRASGSRPTLPSAAWQHQTAPSRMESRHMRPQYNSSSRNSFAVGLSYPMQVAGKRQFSMGGVSPEIVSAKIPLLRIMARR